MSILMKMFISFLQVGLFSVGGGYAAVPLIQDRIVYQYRLLTMSEFSDLVTIAEMTPGPISINASTFVGMRLSGFGGACLCTLACVIPSFFICLVLAHFYFKYRNLNGVQIVLSSLRPAVIAMIASAGLTILMLSLFNADLNSFKASDFRPVELGIFILSLFLLRKYKVGAVKIILGSGVLGTLIYLLIGTAPLI